MALWCMCKSAYSLMTQRCLFPRSDSSPRPSHGFVSLTENLKCTSRFGQDGFFHHSTNMSNWSKSTNITYKRWGNHEAR